MGVCGGGGGAEAPQKSQQEIELQQEQLKLLRQQAADNAAFKPYLMKNMGLIDDNGTLRQMTEAEQLAGMTESEKQSYDLLKKSLERQGRAAAGTLEVSPLLEQSISEQERMADEGLQRRLGTNYRTTTPGILSVGNFNQKANLLRDESRHGEISSGTGLLLNQSGYLTGQTNQNSSNMIKSPFASNALMGSYGMAQQPYINERSGLLSANIANAQNSSQQLQGLGSLLGQGVGMYSAFRGSGGSVGSGMDAGRRY